MSDLDNEAVAYEVIGVCNSLINGEVTLVYIDRSWNDIFAGNVRFELSNGYLLEVFNDCDEYDYIDTIIRPDGSRIDFDWLYENGLDSYGYPLLETILKNAPPKVICL